MTSAVKRTMSSLRGVLFDEQREVLKVAGLLMIPSLLTKMSGLLYQVLTATQLSTKVEFRDFLYANQLPETLATILLTGAVTTLIIPMLIEVKERDGREHFLKMYNSIQNMVLGLFAIIGILVIIFADVLFPLIIDHIIRPGPGVVIDEVSRTNIIAMMRVLMIPQLILGLSVFVSSALNVYHRLFVPQLAPLFYNVGRIFGVFILLPLMSRSPWALVWGIVIGSLMHLLIQLPLARTLKIDFQWVLSWRDKYVQKFLVVVIPRTLAFGADTIALKVTELIASGLSVKALPALEYANNLVVVIPSLFGYSFAVASFPTLSQLYVRKNFQEMGLLISRTVNQIFFLGIPFVVSFLILRLPVVRLVYGIIPRTEFKRDDTYMVAWILLFFCLGIIFITCNWYLYRLLFIIGNTLVPTLMSLALFLLTVGGSLVFSNLLSHSNSFTVGSIQLSWQNLFTQAYGQAGVGGVALAVSVVGIVQFLALLVVVHKLVVKLDFKYLIGELIRKLLPTGVMTILMYFMYKTWDIYAFPIDATPGFGGSTTLNLIVLTGITMLTCFMVYYLLCILVGVEDIKILRRFLNPVFKIGGIQI